MMHTLSKMSLCFSDALGREADGFRGGNEFFSPSDADAPAGTVGTTEPGAV